MERLFYRIGSIDSIGLWYNKDGSYTGLIHNEFNWLNASKLEMPFDKELVNYISVADSLEHFYQWFNREEILKLQDLGFSIFEYSAIDWKFYSLYTHNVIHQESSLITNKLKLI